MKTRSANTKEDKPYVGVQLTPEEREKIGKAAENAGRTIAGQLRWMIRQLPDGLKDWAHHD